MGRLRGKLRSLRSFLQSAGGFTRLPKQQQQQQQEQQRPTPISRAASTRSDLSRSFSTSAAFSLPDPLPSSSAMLKRCDSAMSSCSRRLPKGYLPVRVGEDEQLVYAVKAKILNDPVFSELLLATAEESQPGILHLYCDIRTFERTIALLSTK